MERLLSSLTVDLIMTPREKLETCEEHERIECLVGRLEKFDLLPVSSSDIRHFVSKSRVEPYLRRKSSILVSKVMQPISQNRPIPEDEQISDYLLQRKSPVFITKKTKNTKVVGIVTPADLNKTPAKMLFYVLISSFEKLLIESIKNLNLTDEEIEECIRFSKWCEAKGRHKQAKREGFERSPINCLNTKELIDIACKYQSIRERLKYQNEPAAHKSLNPLAKLRNNIMHAGNQIIWSEKQLILRGKQYKILRKHITDLSLEISTVDVRALNSARVHV